MSVRRPVLTQEKLEHCVRLISAGNYAKQAALASGFSERSFHRWMREGERLAKELEDNRLNEADLDDFQVLQWQLCLQVKKAEAEAEATALIYIRQAAQDHWQAAAWMLERKYKDRWGRYEKIEQSGTVNHKLELPHSEEEVRELEQAIKEAGQLPAPSNLDQANGLEGEKNLETIDGSAVELED